MAFGLSIPDITGPQDSGFGLSPDMLASIRQMMASPAAPGADQPAAASAPAQASPAAPGAPMTDQQALVASAQRLGLSPVEWGGILHYESGADPGRWGGAKNADGTPRHVGLIQFGPDEQKQFGVTGKESFQEQLPKAEAFLMARGYKPGMGVMNAYSTINAGSPGRFNASDAGNGGMPGTVADKVNTQFAPHYAWANKFLGGGMQLPNAAGGSSAPAAFGLAGPTQGRGAGTVMPGGGGAMATPEGTAMGAGAGAAQPDAQTGLGGQGAGQSKGGQGGQKQGGPSPMQFRTVRPRPFGFMAPMQFSGQGTR